MTDRSEILRRFETLLDSALASEAPPAGLDPAILDEAGPDDGRECDSYALWSSMTALTQEIKLQGRAFQDLTRSLAAQTDKVADKVAAELRALYAEREKTAQRETERRCRKDALNALIDLRDRLVHGLFSAGCRRTRPSGPSFLEGIFGGRLANELAAERAAVDALIRGYELGMERVDQALDEARAREIRCLGEAFDPRLMNAVESEESDSVPDGTVLEVYRAGYEWNGEVFRPAQVKVSRASGSRGKSAR